jgi:hypothetical protein
MEYLHFAYLTRKNEMANDSYAAITHAGSGAEQAHRATLHPAVLGPPSANATPARGPVDDLRQFRVSRRESQEKFWGRFGVTQSSGSRFETGLAIPAPVAILLKLYVNGKLTDDDLQE